MYQIFTYSRKVVIRKDAIVMENYVVYFGDKDVIVMNPNLPDDLRCVEFQCKYHVEDKIIKKETFFIYDKNKQMTKLFVRFPKRHLCKFVEFK